MYGDNGTAGPGSAVSVGPSHPALANFGEPGSADPEKLPHTCRCGARWRGSRTAHCAAECHRTFTGPTTFDAHRRGGRCVHPATPAPHGPGLALVPGRAYAVWGNLGERDED